MRTGALVLTGAVYGYVAAALLGRFTKPQALRQAMNRIVADVLEFRLFVDEPRLVFRAQRDLLKANAELLRQIAIPSLLAGAVFALAWLPMHRYFSTAPLKIGEAALAEARSIAPGLDLLAPFGIAVETPPLRLAHENSTVWRIRALSPVNGDFRTAPVPYPVTVHYPPAKYLGMPWPALFFAASGIGMLVSRRKAS